MTMLSLAAACGPAGQSSTTTTEVLASTPTSVATSTTVGPGTSVPSSPPISSTTSTAAEPDPVARIVETMSLRAKAAQLIMLEFVGADGSAARRVLDDYPVGGFLMKSANGNFVSADQVRGMTTLLQSESEIPLLFAVDQEGGRIDRIRFDGFQRFPSAQVFGTLNDPGLTERAAWATGVQLAGLGINVDFAPVADVNLLGDGNPAIGDRAFGDDPELVATMARAAVDGFQSAGVAPAVKHFPGHGNTAVDSHIGLPVVGIGVEEWTRLDRVPFKATIEAGVPMVMVGHISFPALDPDGLPASLSESITGGELRTGLGFTGVIVTDDLASMEALAGWSTAERAVMALVAGADLLLNPGEVAGAVAAILDAVEEGRLTESLIDQALLRILHLKADLGLFEAGATAPLDPATREAVAAIGREVSAACVAAGFDC
ncbi:MAG: glycoside hydrolase family 3 protein [Acidimicrobiia bacterium]|nr:glycoside hydrolase family 3 protein [Acidimicrobiia bacterium]